MNNKLTIEEIFRHKEQLKFEVIQAIEKYQSITGLVPIIETKIESISIGSCIPEYTNYEVEVTQNL